MYFKMLVAGVVIVCSGSQIFGQKPEDSMTLGQQKVQDLAFMVGEWDITEKNGETKRISVRKTNNNSFLELISGDYREIIGWDLKDQRFVSRAFGEVGGHARYVWDKSESDDAWQQVADPAYYVADGTAVPFSAKLKQIDNDTMSYTAQLGDQKIENVAQRRQPKLETNLSKHWREFLTGTWTRETNGNMDGEPTASKITWNCVASGDSVVSYGTSGDRGYGTLLFWDEELGKLTEQGHSSDGTWKIEFDLMDVSKSAGVITGRLVDGRTGSGTVLIERLNDASYTATIHLDLSDGNTLDAVDKNVRH